MKAFKQLLIAALFGTLFSQDVFAGSGTITVLDSTGATKTFDVVTDGSGHFVATSVICDQSAAANCAGVDAGHSVQVAGEGTAGSPAGGVVSIQGVSSGTTVPVSGSVSLTGATNNINNIAGTVSLPTGAATSANQATEITSLATIATNTGAALPDCGSLPCTNKIGVLAPLTATSTQTKVTITTAGTYQQYLASNTARKGCTIQFITSSHTGYVFFGATPADTTTSWQLSPGQSLNCNVGSEVLTDAIQLTSSNNSDVFVVNSW